MNWVGKLPFKRATKKKEKKEKEETGRTSSTKCGYCLCFCFWTWCGNTELSAACCKAKRRGKQGEPDTHVQLVPPVTPWNKKNPWNGQLVAKTDVKTTFNQTDNSCSEINPKEKEKNRFFSHCKEFSIYFRTFCDKESRSLCFPSQKTRFFFSFTMKYSQPAK